MKRFLQFIVACVPMVFCMMLIFHLSSQEASVSSATSRSFIADLFSVFPGFRALSTYHKLQVIGQAQFFVRKAAHLAIYTLLGVLAMLPSYVVFQKWGRSRFRRGASHFCFRYRMNSIRRLSPAEAARFATY